MYWNINNRGNFTTTIKMMAIFKTRIRLMRRTWWTRRIWRIQRTQRIWRIRRTRRTRRTQRMRRIQQTRQIWLICILIRI